MPENKELFDFLKISENGKEAEKLNLLISAVNAQIKNNQSSPSPSVINMLKAAAEQKVQKKNAIKNWFNAFTYKRAAIAAAAVVMLIAAPLAMREMKNVALEKSEVYAANSQSTFDNIDSDLDDVLYELQNI